MTEQRIEMDKARALALLEEVVAERGEEYIYPFGECTYVRYGSPSCIVGVALHRAGVTIDGLRLMDEQGEVSDNPVFYSLVEATHDAVDVLAAAQFEQDAGYTWGEALKAAKAVANG